MTTGNVLDKIADQFSHISDGKMRQIDRHFSLVFKINFHRRYG